MGVLASVSSATSTVTLPESAPKRRTAATSALNLAIWPRTVRSLTSATFATRRGTWQRTALMGTRRPATSVGARVILLWNAQVKRQFQEQRDHPLQKRMRVTLLMSLLVTRFSQPLTLRTYKKYPVVASQNVCHTQQCYPLSQDVMLILFQ